MFKAIGLLIMAGAALWVAASVSVGGGIALGILTGVYAVKG